MPTYKQQAIVMAKALAEEDIVPYAELPSKLLNIVILQNFAIIELLEKAATKADTIRSTCND